MKKIVPNFIFDKYYDAYYIFCDSEVILNDNFSKNLEIFLQKNNSKEIIFEIEVPSKKEVLQTNKFIYLANPNATNISKFYEQEFEINDDKLVLCLFNYFMRDDTKLWEAYISSDNQICIVGCNNRLSSLFEVVFNPYEEESLETKYKIIGDMFNDENARLNFIESLEKNYRFSEFC